MQKMTKYTERDFRLIIRGYRQLDRDAALSTLLRDVFSCSKCHIKYPDRHDHPANLLVRPLPLPRLDNRTDVDKYFIRIKRDHGHLRNMLEEKLALSEFLSRVGSARFSIGLLPWLDYSMLHRKSGVTDMMIIGIDFKNFPYFINNEKDHHLPLATPQAPNNIWGPTWRRFWSNLLAAPYEDLAVRNFLNVRGAYFTNSMLCFGGANDPRLHCYQYVECCRPYIERQIAIVKPKCLVSFGDFGCRNVAAILEKYNPDCEPLSLLSRSRNPLCIFRSYSVQDRHRLFHLKFESHDLGFVPLYQPGWSHTAEYRRDYSELREYLQLKI